MNGIEAQDNQHHYFIKYNINTLFAAKIQILHQLKQRNTGIKISGNIKFFIQVDFAFLLVALFI